MRGRRLLSRIEIPTPDGLDLGLLMVLIIGIIFYFWTASSSIPFTFVDHQPDPLNGLADAFVRGHIHLLTPIPQALLKLPDPYDPTANFPFRAAGLQDLSLYHKHLYPYWGPAPILLLLLPWRLLPFGEMPISLAVAIFSSLGLVFAVGLLRLVARRTLPGVHRGALILGALSLVASSGLAFNLRRPVVYEVAISAGACLLMAGLYLLARGMSRPEPRLRDLLGASTCLGAAFNARPDMLLGGVVLLVIAVWVGTHERYPGPGRIRVALIAPFLACVVLTGAYNSARFDSPFEFGNRYQLNRYELVGPHPLQKTFSPSYLAPGMYNYALAPPRITLTFPYVSLPPPPVYPGQLPRGYDGWTPAQAAEVTGGIAPAAPIVLFSLLLPRFWRRYRQDGALRDYTFLLSAASGLALLGVGLMAGIAFTLWGTTQRYQVDFAFPLVLGGVLAWLALSAAASSRHGKRLVGIFGGLAIAWGAFVGVGVSLTGYSNLLQVNHSRLFSDLESATAPLATLPTVLIGRPVITRVQSPEPVSLPNQNYATFGQGGAGTLLGAGEVKLTILSPHAGVTGLAARLAKTPTSSAGPAPSLVVTSPGHGPVTISPAASVILPLYLHWGLNRVVIKVAKVHPLRPVLSIQDMTLVRR